MTVETFKSEEARSRWRDVLDIALTGGRVIVERYAKPQAVILGYKQFSDLVRRVEELEAWREAQRIDRDITEGRSQVVTFEQHKARMGTNYDLGNPVQPRS